MFSSLKLKSQWHAEAGDDFINEPAEICALYRMVGINREDDLVEIESKFYIDERSLSSDLYKEILKYNNILNKIEVFVCFYCIAVSFMKSHSNDGIQLIESTYSEAMKNYVSPLQPIRSIEISEYFFDSEKSIYNKILQLPDYINKPTPFNLLFNETSSEK